MSNIPTKTSSKSSSPESLSDSTGGNIQSKQSYSWTGDSRISSELMDWSMSKSEYEWSRVCPSSTTGTPPVKICRQSQAQDVKEVLSLENTNTKAVFGEVDIADYVEKGICRSLFNERNELVAFIAVQDHPNLPMLTLCNWQGWIRRHYRLDSVQPWNSLFVHYLVWDTRYPDIFRVFLRHFYKTLVRLKHVLLVLPPGVEIFEQLWHEVTCVYPSGDDIGSSLSVQTLHLNLRPQALPKLTIRMAKEEDNIDVQPILYYQGDKLKHIFGDVNLSKVIDLDSKEKAILVAENSQGVTVGVLALTSAVDYQHVYDYFHVPLPEFVGMARVDEFTLRFTEDLGTGLAPDEDVLTIPPDTLSADVEEGSEESSTVSDYSLSVDHSLSTLYLDDDDSEFRIIDPAVHYILTNTNSPVYSSVNSQVSPECSNYYGRPSFSKNILPSESMDTGSSVPRATVKEVISPFLGPKDGFIISMFALHPDLDIRYAFDLLEASFECYLEKTYCLLSLPTDYQSSPLTKYFVRLTPRLSRDFPHELYFVHRNSIFSDFSVRAVSLADLDGVTELIENVSQSRRIRKDLISLLTDDSMTDLQGFVLECEGCIVGVTVISKRFRLHELQPHYKLEEVIRHKLYSREGHGLLRHAVVSVIFLSAAEFLLTQTLHLAGLETLSYCLYPLDAMTKCEMTIPTVLGNLCPVPPRERIVYNMDNLDCYKPEDFVVQQEQEFAFFVTTEKLLNVPVLELNYRVVVVGASDVALSFLENLIYNSAARYIRYNNVTLLSVHGLPLEERPHKAGDLMFPHNGRYTREFLARLGLDTHVNILYGAMTVINREEKMICLNDKHWMRYDYLFLFTGTQFCKPISSSVLETSEGCQREVNLKDVYSRIVDECGENFFLINTTVDASIALSNLKKIFRYKKPGKIIVHGNDIHIYTCLEALLTFGVPGNKIVLVEMGNVCKLRGLDTNSDVEKAVVHGVLESGVVLYQGYSLVNWTMRHKLVNTVMFRSEVNNPLALECLAMFCFSRRATSARTYLAITNSGLVFNDGVIIDNQFRTNDPLIFAAGPGTKYSSRYQATQADHSFFSSLDVGKHVSQVFRRLVEPWPEDDARERPDRLVSMKSPVVLVACLPKGWNYLRVTAPGRPLPLECQLQGQGESGPVLITGNPMDPDSPGYFQLSLSQYYTVREITCLSKREIPYHNLQRLYGLHEKLLNNLLERFNYGLIPDLFSFFSEPWAYAIYTTGFDNLIGQCSDIFQADEDAGLSMFLELEKNIYNNRVSDGTIEKISQLYAMSSVPLYVQNLTLKYVSDHELQLPMYMTDDRLSTIQRNYGSSPLHHDPHKAKHKQRNS